MLKNRFILFLLLIILIHVLVLTKLIFFPFPELFIYPYLTNHGLKPYSQILDQHFPGLMFLPINFNNLGMTTPEIARMWSIGIVVLAHLLLFIISKAIFKDNKKAILVNMLYLIWQPFFEGWVLWIDSFLPLILLPGFYYLQKKKYFLTGLILGTAIIFKQILIPLAGIVFLFLLWQRVGVKKIGIYILGIMIPIGLMLSYYLAIGVLADFWYWTVVFNLTTYAQSGRGMGPSFSHLIRVILVFGSSLIILTRIKEKLAQLLIIFFIGCLFGLSTRFDFVHFQPALPFAVLATIYGVEKIWNKQVIKLLCAVYLLVAFWWLISFYKGYIGDKVFFFDKETIDIASKIKQSTTPGEKIFVFGAAPHLYQMSNTLPAGNVFVFQFPWFFKVTQSRILDGIKRDKPNIIVSDRTSKIEEVPIIEFGKEIDLYISQNYEKIDIVGETEILRKK